MNERIKRIRKYFKLTQDEFGKRIGSARNTIANYENSNRTPSNSVILSICREFGVNEIWLRTGEGGDENMFTRISENDRFSLNLGKLSTTQNKMLINMVNSIAEASPEKLRYIEEFMKDCLGLNE